MDDQKKFYLVSTPIGNLSDMTYRAVEILRSVDVVLCEDTRTTGKLLKHYEISAKMDSYHAHSSLSKEKKIIDEIESGRSFALVSDAGTPTVSDPGTKLVHELYAHFGAGIDVISIPGATALIPALSSSGFMGNQFSFLGFIPHKKGRSTFFSALANRDEICIFYESPHRLMKTLTSLSEALSEDRLVFVARELTKRFEQKIRGSAAEVLNYFQENPSKIKGEFVILVDKK